jgi:hypothetical protein
MAAPISKGPHHQAHIPGSSGYAKDLELVPINGMLCAVRCFYFQPLTGSTDRARDIVLSFSSLRLMRARMATAASHVSIAGCCHGFWLNSAPIGNILALRRNSWVKRGNRVAAHCQSQSLFSQ